MLIAVTYMGIAPILECPISLNANAQPKHPLVAMAFLLAVMLTVLGSSNLCNRKF